MILITGANGRVGRTVVRNLIEGFDVRPAVFVRDIEAARTRFGERVEVRRGDLDDPDSVSRAMRGVTAVFIASPVHPDQVVQQGRVIEAAARAGVSKVVKLSGLATFPGSFVDSGRWHAETESQLAGSGLPFTCLHPWFFMQNLAFQMDSAREKGVIRSAVPDAPIAMVDVRDIAAVAARLLAETDLAVGETLPLTAERAVSHVEIAGLLSGVLGRDVTCERQDAAALERRLRSSGQPDWHVDILLQFNRAFSEGHGREVSGAVRRILGRAPNDIAQWLRDAGSAGDDTDPFPV